MSRLLPATRRPLSSWARFLSRRPPTQHSQVAIFRRVEFQRPGTWVRRATTRLFVGLVSVTVVVAAVSSALSRLEVDDLPSSAQDDDATPWGLFLPVLYFITEHQQDKYKLDSKERLEMAKIARSPEKQAKIKRDMMLHVATVSVTRNYTQLLGPAKSARDEGLEISYPKCPPPRYTVPGIVISSKEIRFVRREPISPNDALMAKRTLWPEIGARAIWAYTYEYIRLLPRNTKRWLSTDKPKEGTEKRTILNPTFAGDEPLRAFNRSIAKSYRSKDIFARPEGGVEVCGPVVIEFDRVKVRFEVKGWWDPQQGAVDKDSTVVERKNVVANGESNKSNQRSRPG